MSYSFVAAVATQWWSRNLKKYASTSRRRLHKTDRVRFGQDTNPCTMVLRWVFGPVGNTMQPGLSELAGTRQKRSDY